MLNNDTTIMTDGVTCPVFIELAPETYSGGIAMLVLVVSIELLMISHLYWHRNSSVLVRKRPINLIMIAAFGSMLTTIPYLLGTLVALPCAFQLIVEYAILPCVCVPTVIRVTQYRSALIKNGQLTSLSMATAEMMVADTQSVVSASTAPSFSKRILTCQDMMTCRCFGPKRVAFLEWAAGPYFARFWMFITSVPFALAVVIKLIVVPEFRTCSGCTLDLFDVIFFAVTVGLISAVGLSIGFALYGKPDPLGIITEMLAGYIVGGGPTLLGLILHLVDPDGIYRVQKIFPWVWLIVIAAMILLFFQTTFILLYARAQQNRGTHFNLAIFSGEDIIEDILSDAELKKILLEYMKAELSEEIMYFNDEVKRWKSTFNKATETGQSASRQRAKKIYVLYVIRGSPMEVNISAKVRDQLTVKITQGDVDADTFDEAQKELLVVLRNDILPRFLASKALKQYLGASSGGKSSRRLHRDAQVAALVPLTSEASASGEGKV